MKSSLRTACRRRMLRITLACGEEILKRMKGKNETGRTDNFIGGATWSIIGILILLVGGTIASASQSNTQAPGENKTKAILATYASTPIIKALKELKGNKEEFVKKLIIPYLDLEDVSQLVIGKKAIRNFLLENKEIIRPAYEHSAGTSGDHSIEEFIERLISTDRVVLATLFFREFYGRDKKFPVAIFDSAFNGEGMVTLEDFVVSLQHFEIDRLKILRTGEFVGSSSTFHLSRKDYMRIDNVSSKIVFEVAAMDNLFSLIKRRQVKMLHSFLGDQKAYRALSMLDFNYRIFALLVNLNSGFH